MRRHRASARGAVRSSLLLLLVILLTGVGVAVYRWDGDAHGPTRRVTVRIPEGSTAADVGGILETAGVIRSGLAFRLSATLRGASSDIQAGRYALTTNMSVPEALDVLERGPLSPTVVDITFPEGLEVGGVADVAHQALGIRAEAFVHRATSGRFSLPPYLPEGTDTVEGFLFPKTYEVAANTSIDQLLTLQLGQFETEAKGLPWERARKLGLSPYQVVIVASMIEREARLPEDRPKVAAVIYNRLRDEMKLQIDATVQYAIPGHNRPLTFEDYEFQSPYNTYLHKGLPPTPVANPGLASLQAALNPSDAGYLYYLLVNEQTGRHQFFESESEFCSAAPGC